MWEIYRAVLIGDQLTWIDPPPHVNVPVEVRVSVPELAYRADASNGAAMAAALAKIAKAAGLTFAHDPVRWQRELRQDRALPSRDS